MALISWPEEPAALEMVMSAAVIVDIASDQDIVQWVL